MTVTSRHTALEFFAGIGLARLGLEQAGVQVSWANDIDADKKALYDGHFGTTRSKQPYLLRDIRTIQANELPANASIAWASSPCTDLSLAGARRGIRGQKSSAFWEFTRILGEFTSESRPPVAVLENVVGLATSNSGHDLHAAIAEFNQLGYSVDIVMLDARRFVPQSRPRLFVIGVQSPPPDDQMSSDLRPAWLDAFFDDDALRTHRTTLPEAPRAASRPLSDYLEPTDDDDPRWWNGDRTSSFFKSMSSLQYDRAAKLREADSVNFRTAYRRTRSGVASWEMRADEIAGCLRTVSGGSSRQAVVRIGRGDARIRWMTPREYANLMGAASYDLSGARNNQALFGFGDAVAVPVVAWLARNYLLPALGDLRQQ